MLAAPLRIACLAIFAAVVVFAPRVNEVPAVDTPPEVLRFSTVTEFAGNVYLKLVPCADSVLVVGATAVGCASEFIALGAPVNVVAVPPRVPDSPVKATVIGAAALPLLTTTT